MHDAPDIRLTPVDESIFKAINAGKFASPDTYLEKRAHYGNV
jgi:hypothetical protein